MDQQVLARRRQILSSALALAVLCAQHATLIMATSTDKANWNTEETASFVDHLYDHRSEITDAGMFKMATFNAAAQHIAPLHTLGPVKTGKMCKTKWRTVRSIYLCIYIAQLMCTYFQLRSIYSAIQKY
jgi:hypothetical protein